ncbi:hypothetical protein STAS_03171 [Striga asiatica]|uniref:Uncharacterized protein n=1 Tax=Striga asiatica TaxID=4170 RepID=A0A5A7P3P3_STRAF|nr:hypothetical protein STAS_03171 [Striga asiatica]
MANKYDHHHNIQNQKTIFLPMLCRLSITDVKPNSHRKTSRPAAGGSEPNSPKVSCMGQVKRNNRVIGYPAAAKPTNANRNRAGKTHLPAAAGGRRSCRISREATAAKNSRGPRKTVDFDRDDVAVVVDVSEMDPPLPVVRRAAAPPGGGRVEVNLWGRRFGGTGGLKRLDLEKIRPPDGGFQQPSSLSV